MMSRATEEQVIGDRVRRARTALGVTQEWLAKRMVDAGLTYASGITVGRIESNGRALRLTEAVVVCEALGVTMEYLISGLLVAPRRPSVAEAIRVLQDYERGE